MFAAFFGLQNYRQSHLSDELTEELSAISSDEIEYIEVYLDEDKKRPILDQTMTSSKKSKSLFANAMRNLLPYTSGHDSAHRRFFIRMTDHEGNLYEYDAWLKMDDHDEMLNMYISKMASTDRSNYQFLGGRKNEGLYQWLKFHDLI